MGVENNFLIEISLSPCRKAYRNCKLKSNKCNHIWMKPIFRESAGLFNNTHNRVPFNCKAIWLNYKSYKRLNISRFKVWWNASTANKHKLTPCTKLFRAFWIKDIVKRFSRLNGKCRHLRWILRGKPWMNGINRKRAREVQRWGVYLRYREGVIQSCSKRLWNKGVGWLTSCLSLITEALILTVEFD